MTFVFSPGDEIPQNIAFLSTQGWLSIAPEQDCVAH
jgi:hypothetical protein